MICFQEPALNYIHAKLNMKYMNNSCFGDAFVRLLWWQQSEDKCWVFAGLDFLQILTQASHSPGIPDPRRCRHSPRSHSGHNTSRGRFWRLYVGNRRLLRNVRKMMSRCLSLLCCGLHSSGYPDRLRYGCSLLKGNSSRLR